MTDSLVARAVVHPGFRPDALSRVAADWQCDDAMMCGLLGGIQMELWLQLKADATGPQVSEALFLHILLLTDIHECLGAILDADMARQWPRAENHGPLFAGGRPIDMMLARGIAGMMAISLSLDRMRGAYVRHDSGRAS